MRLLMGLVTGLVTGLPTNTGTPRRPGRSIRACAPLAAAALVLVAACTDEPTGATPEQGELIPTDYQIVNGFQLTRTVDGVRNAEVVADSSWQWADSTAVRLFGVEMDFYDSLGIATARATASEARLDMESQDMELRGNAVLDVEVRNTTIQSPVLYYSPESQVIRSDTVTRANIDGDLVTGTRFESDLQFRNMTIDNPVGDVPDLMMDTIRTADTRRGGPGIDERRERELPDLDERREPGGVGFDEGRERDGPGGPGERR